MESPTQASMPVPETKVAPSKRPRKPRRVGKAHPLSTEALQPEKAAEFLITRAESPQESLEAIANRVGLSKDVARALEDRINSRYVELKDKVTPIARDLLERRISQRLDLIDAYLSPETLLTKLETSTLAQIGVYEGILMDKLAALRGQPAAIITVTDQRKADQVGALLLKELERRGLAAPVIDVPSIEVPDGSFEPPATAHPDPQ